MKRNDIEVGVEYAVLAPSQRDKVDARYGPSAKHVRVLDSGPNWVERGTSMFRDDAPSVRVEGFGEEAGQTVVAKDRTRPASESWMLAEAGRVVKVLVRREYGFGGTQTVDYAVEVVSVSMLAMTWAEYTLRREAAKVKAAEEDRKRAAVDKVVEGLRSEVRTLEGDLGVRAGLSEYTDRVTMTTSQYRALLLRLRTAEGVE